MLPALVAGLLLITATGVPVALGLRVRGFTILVVTVPAAFASIALASILAPILHFSWSILVPIAISVLFGAVLWLITLRLPAISLDKTKNLRTGWPLLGVTLASAISFYTFYRALPNPEAVSQTYDALFHLNASRLVLDGGNASPFAMDLATPGSPTFYPTLWHATVALITQLSGASIPLATNAMTVLTITVVWSVGAVALGRAAAGSTATASLTSGVFAAAFPSLPLALAGYGVLYPNLLAMVLVPYVIVGVMALLGAGTARESTGLNPVNGTLLVFGALGAASLAHPNALHVTFLLTFGFLIAAIVHQFSRHGTLSGRVIALLGLLMIVTVGLGLWIIGRTTLNPWGGIYGPRRALLEALGTAPRLSGDNWVVTILILVGILVALRRRHLWPLIFSFVNALAWYILADGFPQGPLREIFLAPWYSDPWRLAAVLPIAMLPLAVLGTSQLILAILPQLQRFTEGLFSRRSLQILTPGVLLLALGIAVVNTSHLGISSYLSGRYDDDPKRARLLSSDEMALLERLDSHVDEGDRIIVNPWNGGALAYAISDREVLLPHVTGSYDPLVWQATGGITVGTPSACAAAAELGASYVLDFGEEYIFNSEIMPPELDEVSGIIDAPALTKVDGEGEAVLYAITGCE